MAAKFELVMRLHSRFIRSAEGLNDCNGGEINDYPSIRVAAPLELFYRVRR